MTDATAAKRRPGRPPGYPKTGGRKKGTPNKDRSATVERIMQSGDPIGFLVAIGNGSRIPAAPATNAGKRTWCYPTLDQRMRAAEILLRKVIPDVKATELSGREGGPVEVNERLSDLEIARRVMFLLYAAGQAKSQPDGDPQGAE